MRRRTFFLTRSADVVRWARSNSLWCFSTGVSCCADEVASVLACQYDVERFGVLAQTDPSQADLLIVSGSISRKAAAELLLVYEQMIDPKYVLALGACACSGGLFTGKGSYAVVPGVQTILPVDVFVPGCPPRPEAVINGILKLKEKISSGEASGRSAHSN